MNSRSKALGLLTRTSSAGTVRRLLCTQGGQGKAAAEKAAMGNTENLESVEELEELGAFSALSGMGLAAFGAVGLAGIGAVGAFQMASWVSKEAGYADLSTRNKTSKPSETA